MFTYGLRNEEKKQICLLTSETEWDYNTSTISIMDLFASEDDYYKIMDILKWNDDDVIFVDYVGNYEKVYEDFYGDKDYEITSYEYVLDLL